MFEPQQLDTVLEDIITRWGIPGLGVGLVENGEIADAPITSDSIANMC